jgi:hypothetical protein
MCSSLEVKLIVTKWYLKFQTNTIGNKRGGARNLIEILCRKMA